MDSTEQLWNRSPGESSRFIPQRRNCSGGLRPPGMNEIGASLDFAQDRRRAPLQHHGVGVAVAEALALGVGVAVCASGNLSAFKSGLLITKTPSCSSVFAN